MELGLSTRFGLGNAFLHSYGLICHYSRPGRVAGPQELASGRKFARGRGLDRFFLCCHGKVAFCI